tara:strand:+ start:7212 stop:7475 length:264 start_codon:yes stop_codon:yes gene_type:complete
MKLTGKCREDFEKWFTDNDNHKGFDAEQIALDRKYRLKLFYQLYPSMQYGVYEDFFRSVKKLKSISGARVAAIEKENEIYNKKLKTT